MSRPKHMVEKDCTLQFYKGEDRISVDLEGNDIFVLRNKHGENFLLDGYDEIEDVITLLTRIKETKLMKTNFSSRMV